MAQHEGQGHVMAHGGAGESFEPQFHFGTDDFNQDFFAAHNGVLLNPQEQEQMNQFWNDPNSNTDSFLFNNLFMDSKLNADNSGETELGGYESTSPTARHPPTSLHSVSKVAYDAHSNLGSSHVTDSNHVTDSGPNLTHLSGDTDVTAAASSLFGMSVNSNQHSSNINNHTNTKHHNGSIWNNMNYSQDNAAGTQGESHSSPGAQAGGITSSTSGQGQQEQQQQQQQHQQQQHGMVNLDVWQPMHVPRPHHSGPSDGGRDDPFQTQAPTPMHYLPQQLPHGQWHQVPPQYLNHHNFKPSMQWGSDQNFSLQGFRGQHDPDVIAKHGNLLGVPMAHQAAALGYPQMQPFGHGGGQPMYNGHRMSLPSPSLGPAYTPPNAHDEYEMPAPPSAPRRTSIQEALAKRPGRHSGEIAGRARTPPRKRRRSGEEEDDDDYVPHVHAKVSAPKSSSKYSKARMIKQEEGEEDDIEQALQRSAKRRKSSGAGGKSHGYAPGSPSSPGPADTPNSRDNSGEIKIRSNLSDVQKRSNHIRSEQRRRNTIKDGYADIDRLVPALKNGKSGLSKSDALFEAVKFIQRTVAGNNFLERKMGIRFEKVYHHVGNDDDDDGGVEIQGFDGANDEDDVGEA